MKSLNESKYQVHIKDGYNKPVVYHFSTLDKANSFVNKLKIQDQDIYFSAKVISILTDK